eukprot:CAMPEP_0172531402 /NCGR_PEP_ID=MMETSP1067-20121228/4834_1 /TAXON_ID=265564 ORGANISM="Thalassiosira punctigera, Strain Tpunct2005C2" /NCGR_SAMPLE_ID=MMETSP1067 /ASSEMBLY_ACC=CAM_ASM_000444 /LENGTH=154 /DNA_ID=CAMNT_0013315781 /DNA_START=82 /DNA_END=546 /DNA_ORIENTATION=-
MASKIPPHVARELRRHVAKRGAPTAGSSSSGGPSPSSSATSDFSFSRPKVLAGCFALTATMTIVPYVFVNWIQPLSDRDGALTKSQIRRGAFNNSGSTDAGKDPYWDFKRGRRKKVGEDGCEDDGGYDDLFKRDNPNEVDHGEEIAAKSRRRVI